MYAFSSISLASLNVQFTDINWINALLNGYIRFANCTNFHFDLSEEDKEPTQVSRYCEGEYYSIHPDFSGDRDSKSHTRKLSLSRGYKNIMTIAVLHSLLNIT